MEPSKLDLLSRAVLTRLKRRTVVSAAAATFLTNLGNSTGTGAKRKKKSVLCLDGQTVTASGKKKKKLIKSGATLGSCPAVCTPRCSGCGGSDGCGGTCGCGENAICDGGSCRACEVVCTGNPVACGSQLSQELLNSGTIHVCPGRYAGNFEIAANTTLIGAGSGDDPARNTVLDARDNGRVLKITDAVTQVKLVGLRLTGGNVENTDLGGAILALSAHVQAERCALVANKALYGGAMYLGGRLQLTESLVTDNSAAVAGGIYLDGCDDSYITDSTISQNHATAGVGGGIAVGFTSLTVVGSEITTNDASVYGGSIAAIEAQLTLDADTTITRNTAAAPGGGLHLDDQSTFEGNGAVITDNVPDNCFGC